MEKYRYEQKGIRIIRKLILGAFVFATANVAGGLWLSKSNMNRANRAEGQNNLINTTILKRGRVDIKGNTDNAYITCLTGKMNIFVQSCDIKTMYVEIVSVLSDVKIHVPNNVKIIYDRPSDMDNPNSCIDNGMDELPEIHFNVKSKISKTMFLVD